MTITRSEVLRRAQSIWPMQGVPYSQSSIHQPDGYRQDCSGYVSACWGIPLDAPGSWGGMNTVSLVTDGWMREIKPDDLKPGDAIGNCGPGTAGDGGHIQLFTGWLNTDPNDSRYYCLEQSGGRSGPHRELHNWPSSYKAYRFRDITDDAPSGGTVTQPLGKDNDGAYLIWRVEGMAHLRDAVLGGPAKGEPLELVKAIKDIQANVAKAAAAPKGEVVLTDADRAAIIDGLAAKVADELAKRLGNG